EPRTGNTEPRTPTPGRASRRHRDRPRRRQTPRPRSRTQRTDRAARPCAARPAPPARVRPRARSRRDATPGTTTPAQGRSARRASGTAMIPLSLFLLACAALYLGTLDAAFGALMRLSLRLMAERSDRPGALGAYLDDPLLLFIPVRLLL